MRNVYVIANGRAIFCSQPIRRPKTVPKWGTGTPRVYIGVISTGVYISQHCPTFWHGHSSSCRLDKDNNGDISFGEFFEAVTNMFTLSPHHTRTHTLSPHHHAHTPSHLTTTHTHPLASPPRTHPLTSPPRTRTLCPHPLLCTHTLSPSSYTHTHTLP